MNHLTGMGNNAADALAGEDGTSLSTPSKPHAPILSGFGPGVMVDTNEGPQPVEWLRPGDLVQTRDNGFQPLRWTGRSALGAKGTQAPVRIYAGALAGNTPEHDLILSPNHHVMVQSPEIELLFAENEVFVPVESMATEAEEGFEPSSPNYALCHLLFDRHEVVMAEGVWLESLYVDRDTLWLFSEDEAETIHDILGPRIDEMVWARMPLNEDETCLIQSRRMVSARRMVA